MTYIENIFICLAIPMLFSLFFTMGAARKMTIFVVIGLGMCLLSAYVSSFFMGIYGASAMESSVEIAPVCEEIMKFLALLLYFFVFEPSTGELPSAALAMAVGFATFENTCYLAENGAENFSFLLLRGFSAGALHILCGIVCGFGISYVFRQRWLAVTGIMGILGFCVGFHGIYNLLITAQGLWRTAGYIFPVVGIVVLYILRRSVHIHK